MNKEQNRYGKYLWAGVIVFLVVFAGAMIVQAQLKYKAGDRVECDSTESGKWWTKGTIMAFEQGDFGGGQEPDGTWYRFKADYNKVEYPCKPAFIRSIAGAAKPAGAKVETPADNGVGAEDEPVATGDFVECPIQQKQARGAARPDAELFKKLIRCKKGEMAVEAGDEGAVKVDIAAIQIGAPRPWSYSQDIGNVKPGTSVYPVKATYNISTFYRKATEVEEGWVRIINFYVNAFGEWQIGSEESIKGGKSRRISK